MKTDCALARWNFVQATETKSSFQKKRPRRIVKCGRRLANHCLHKRSGGASPKDDVSRRVPRASQEAPDRVRGALFVGVNSAVPSGLNGMIVENPTLKRWAVFKGPSGTNTARISRLAGTPAATRTSHT